MHLGQVPQWLLDAILRQTGDPRLFAFFRSPAADLPHLWNAWACQNQYVLWIGAIWWNRAEHATLSCRRYLPLTW